jgi:hypothetical protein
MQSVDRAREFREQGFVVERGFFPKDEISAVLGEIERCIAEDSKGKVAAPGELIFTIETFRRSEIVRQFIAQQRIIDFLKPIAGSDLWVRWDQAVTKRPGAGVFHWHQDNAFNKLQTEHFQVWVALTESTQQNGGLWLAPGSHKRGMLPHERRPGQRVVQAEVGESVCVDASAGDLIVFSSLMLHRTGPNDADTSRVAFVTEYMPLRDYDYAASGPYFVVAENGISNPHFVDRQVGENPDAKRRYLKERVVRSAGHAVHRLRDSCKTLWSRDAPG